jgi:metallo-beta-lactamase family protein
MPAPQPPVPAEVLLVESTYGNRLHPHDDVAAQLAAIVRDTVQRGGSVLLPSFAVGRAQALLLCIARLKAAGRIPDAPVFLDSPMAAQATAIHARHAGLLRIDRAELDLMLGCARFVETPDESKAVSQLRYPSIIIAASGMATGGRVLHHLKAMMSDERHHIVFPGFQVPGTRGARLVAGETSVKIFGEYVPVRARISHLEGFSGHADAEGLLRWLRRMPQVPARTFVIHGERAASDALRCRIEDELRWPQVRVPEHLETVLLPH